MYVGVGWYQRVPSLDVGSTECMFYSQCIIYYTRWPQKDKEESDIRPHYILSLIVSTLRTPCKNFLNKWLICKYGLQDLLLPKANDTT